MKRVFRHLICASFRPSTRLYIVAAKFFSLPSFFPFFPRERVDTFIIKSTSSRYAHSTSRNYSRRVNVHGFVWISKYMRIRKTKSFVSYERGLEKLLRITTFLSFYNVSTRITFEFLNCVVAGNTGINSRQTARDSSVKLFKERLFMSFLFRSYFRARVVHFG